MLVLAECRYREVLDDGVVCVLLHAPFFGFMETSSAELASCGVVVVGTSYWAVVSRAFWPSAEGETPFCFFSRDRPEIVAERCRVRNGLVRGAPTAV